ncbi:peptidyl-prolyl cis-trans isomerase [Phaeobacter sp. 22II1-1F12B]|uniref:peptidyl-prolyl cis-trans isomerase n=1 Tax=Phaeobacter sp. 22II1-1F12B TaxID=1317111 RepID=UPI000B5239C7|nr:peptidyl-prolyl cis-trans isomerase [Phaeobacter sp. 22II1-1F12B]OWU73166.1 peptidylprolyl isomerase [Phaeobacter sp. 22II1-1F12B]
MAVRVKNLSKTFVWIIVGLLLIGLMGFGATNFSGTVRTIGSVGDQNISVDAFARELQREMRAIQAQTGQPMTIADARSYGLDQSVVARLTQLAALDHETEQLGLSVGDENLQREIIRIPAFQGLDGNFDRETYRFALEQANLNENVFEDDLRAESARTLVQSAIVSGVEMPDTMADTLTDYIAARRSFTWAPLGEEALSEPLPEPTEAELQAYYDENGAAFTLPETKMITYVLLTPADVLDDIAVDADAIRRLYDERISEFSQPERRLVERLVYPNEEAASNALAQVEVGGATFESLVQDRGLELDDIDMGDVIASDLGDAADEVFSADVGDVVGPLPSDLGPALFRVNGKLDARTTTFEDVEDQLRDELAGDQARRQIEARAEPIEDILAGGATLEEAAEETELTIGTLEWTPDSAEGPAAYATFNEAAAEVTSEDFPQIDFLDDGGIFALRLDETLPERPEPFDSAREKVAEAWRQDALVTALATRAEEVVATLSENGDFTETGLSFKVENGLTRSAYIDQTPADFMNQVFEMETGEYRVITGETGVIIVRLEEILPPADTADVRDLRQSLSTQLDQSLSQALFSAYARDTQLRARARIDQRSVEAVLGSFN